MGYCERVITPRLMHWTLRRGDVSEYREWIVPRAGGRVRAQMLLNGESGYLQGPRFPADCSWGRASS